MQVRICELILVEPDKEHKSTIANLEPHEVEQECEYTMSMNECNEFMTIKNAINQTN